MAVLGKRSLRKPCTVECHYGAGRPDTDLRQSTRSRTIPAGVIGGCVQMPETTGRSPMSLEEACASTCLQVHQS
jgi:hypothetical protein